jgi:hypothetical protein
MTTVTALRGTWMYELYQQVWSDFLKLPLDEIPYDDRRIREFFKAKVLDAPWYEAYDLIEFVLNGGTHKNVAAMRASVIRVLDEEKAGFRVINDSFVEVTDECEIAAIEEALRIPGDRFAPVRTHIENALALLSDRRAPDYRNSVKESISAVEATVQILTGDSRAELGKALNLLAAKAPIHGAFAAALKSLYGYTSDAQGIRHALSDEPTLDSADAKFMLVSCAAFVVYLIAKSA